MRAGPGDFKNSTTTCQPKRTTCPSGLRFVKGTDEVKTKDDTQCVACPSNTFKEADDGATSCTPQPFCGVGEHITPDTKAMTRECKLCVNGTFMAIASHRQIACTPWTECNQAGQFEVADGTADADRKCAFHGSCTDTEFETIAPTATSTRVCEELTACRKGQFVIFTPTVTSDLTCGACIGNTYQDQDQSRADACLPQPLCGPREYMSPPSSTAKRTCLRCGDGQYQGEDGHANEECVTKQTQAACPNGTTFVPGVNEVRSRDDGRCTAACTKGERRVESNTTFVVEGCVLCGVNETCYHAPGSDANIARYQLLLLLIN